MNQMKIFHTLKPIFNTDSKILILGSIPSPKSRETGFYYNHPQNRFWKVISKVLSQNTPITNNEKEHFLLNNHIALWDVLFSCEISGANDASIKNPVPNDINHILSEAPIQAVFTTGKKAYILYQKYCFPKTKTAAISLPSTSPANAKFNLTDLIKAYQIIKDYLKKNISKNSVH